MSDNNKVLIAKLTTAHGLKGELRGQFFTNDFDSFRALAPVNIKNPRKAGHDTFITNVQGIYDRDAAQAAVGTEIFTDRDALPDLKNDTYYISDLIGMDAYRGNEFLGKVVAAHNFGAGDILELENGEMISFVGAKVDMEKKCISIS
ncbi:MAG: ribosome maturation factor RimM [Alphaproteobacteria bacterium]|nr:ribosome maturation factor RimM [Alphaproteobacteria bacterium]